MFQQRRWCMRNTSLPAPHSIYHSVRPVFPGTAGRLACQTRPSRQAISLSQLPAYTDRRLVCLRPSCFNVDPPKVGSVDAITALPRGGILHRPQGSSLRIELCCLEPSSLTRPHPPRSRAHRNFTARRLICDASAVRERLGHPRAVPGFRCPFRPDMPSPATPGSSNVDKFQSSDVDIAFTERSAVRHSQ